ncbi:retrovirus-related pol polyprotein from transposon TNT 1-94 [Tanacetum coccineum]
MHSTTVNYSTSASGSKPSGNTKNNRITQSSSSNKINNVEDQSRSVKSRKNKINRVDKTECNAHVMQSMLNANSATEPIGNALIDYVNDVNVHSKAKSKRNKERKVWKPTGKMFTIIGYNWKPTGRTCAIIRNRCPLTRITSTKIVPTKETTTKSVLTPTQGILVYSRRPKSFLELASKTKSWLWHRRLSHLNFDYITSIAKHGLVRRLLKLKYYKVHLCSACALGKSKKHSHKPKAEDSIQEKLYLLHMDLCGPMRIQSINGRRYILVIVDDYSWFTWVKLLRSKDEVLTFVIKFLKMIQIHLNTIVCNIRTDNGTEFANQTLQAVATKPDLSYLHVFGALCYPTNDGEDLGKLRPKADIEIFVGYAPAKKAFRIYNKRTRMIMETIHVNFDELTAMASEQFSSGLRPKLMTPRIISSGLVQNIPSSTPNVPPTKNDWEETMFSPCLISTIILLQVLIFKSLR